MIKLQNIDKTKLELMNIFDNISRDLEAKLKMTTEEDSYRITEIIWKANECNLKLIFTREVDEDNSFVVEFNNMFGITAEEIRKTKIKMKEIMK